MRILEVRLPVADNTLPGMLMFDMCYSTLDNISKDLQALYEQGRFAQIALHEQNKRDLERFGRELERAYWNLQVSDTLS